MLPRPLTPLFLALGLTLLALAFLWVAPLSPVLEDPPQLVSWLLVAGTGLTLAGGVPLLRSMGRG